MNSEWRDTCIDFSPEAVMKKLKRLHIDKAPGPDGLHSMLLDRVLSLWQNCYRSFSIDCLT